MRVSHQVEVPVPASWMRALCVLGVLLCPLVAAPPAEAIGDRELKLRMIEGLGTAPDLVMPGSSRVLKYDPEDVRRITGLTAFNAGVSSGDPDDAWRYVSYLDATFPAAFPHVVWAIDVEQFVPEGRDRALGGRPAATRVPSPLPKRPGSWVTDSGQRFTSRGFRSWDFHDRADKRGITVPFRIQRNIREYRELFYGSGRFPRVSRLQLSYLEHTIRLANERGDEPVLFLTPMHDTALRALRKRGFAARKAELLQALESLRAEGGLRFQVHDLTLIGTFGGRRADVYDGVHMRVANTRRVIRWLHARGAFARPAEGAATSVRLRPARR
jgi:hypothetical protein